MFAWEEPVEGHVQVLRGFEEQLLRRLNYWRYTASCPIARCFSGLCSSVSSCPVARCFSGLCSSVSSRPIALCALFSVPRFTSAFTGFLMMAMPTLVSMATLSVYGASATLTPQVIFPALGYFNILQGPANQLPALIVGKVQKATPGRACALTLHEKTTTQRCSAARSPRRASRSSCSKRRPACPRPARAPDPYVRPSPRPPHRCAMFNGAVQTRCLQPHVALTAASFVWSPPKSETAEPDAAATQPALASPTSPTTRVALNDITLDVRAGELVVVTGAVGSGKSALIRALAGALAPVRIRAQRTCHYVGWLTLPAFPSSSTVLSR